MALKLCGSPGQTLLSSDFLRRRREACRYPTDRPARSRGSRFRLRLGGSVKSDSTRPTYASDIPVRLSADLAPAHQRSPSISPGQGMTQGWGSLPFQSGTVQASLALQDVPVQRHPHRPPFRPQFTPLHPPSTLGPRSALPDPPNVRVLTIPAEKRCASGPKSTAPRQHKIRGNPQGKS